MAKFEGEVLDFKGEETHNYPATKEQISRIRFYYDFIFTREGKWFYASSSSDAEKFEKMRFHKPIEENGEEWKVINAISGQIISESAPKKPKRKKRTTTVL